MWIFVVILQDVTSNQTYAKEERLGKIGIHQINRNDNIVNLN